MIRQVIFKGSQADFLAIVPLFCELFVNVNTRVLVAFNEVFYRNNGYKEFDHTNV